MAEQLLDQAQELFEGQIVFTPAIHVFGKWGNLQGLQDFEGQRLVELLTTGILSAVGVIAFIVGFVLQDIRFSLWAGLGGTALAFIVVVPPWPFFKRNPLQWLPPQGQTGGISVEVDGQKVT
ncbi:MAG: hypothetical protein M1820_005434 [Bogoriella megaspora]|nr:MAG: hypothetical protein M1820_005434 [Bogoriella megaspora]